MAISEGEKIPSVSVMMATENGPEKADAADVLGSGKIALFSVPGAFTPTCSAKHLPGFVEKAGELKAKGIDKIVCVSVNDAFVMDAWGKAHNAGGTVEMMADGNGDCARARPDHGWDRVWYGRTLAKIFRRDRRWCREGAQRRRARRV